MKKKILISSCLLGEKVRYDGKIVSYENSIIKKWLEQDILISFCPEVKGGLEVPRAPSEIISENTEDIFNNDGKIINVHGINVTSFFIHGAEDALKVSKSNNVKVAVLKEGSPSCSNTYIYDGTFSGKKKTGKGITAFLLEKNDIKVFNENQINEANEYLEKLLAKK